MTSEEAEQRLERAKYLLSWHIVPQRDILFGKDLRASVRATTVAFDNALKEIYQSTLSAKQRKKFSKRLVADFAALSGRFLGLEMELAEADKQKTSTTKDDFKQFMDRINGSVQ